jgi:hypothetical protein
MADAFREIWDKARDFLFDKFFDWIWSFVGVAVTGVLVASLLSLVAYIRGHQALLDGSLGAVIACVAILALGWIRALFVRPLPPEQAQEVEEQFKHLLDGQVINISGMANTVATTSMTDSSLISLRAGEQPKDLTLVVRLDAASERTEQWPKLSATKRQQIGNQLRDLEHSTGRMFDVTIWSADLSDCRDLAVDLRDSIKQAGLTAEIASEYARELSPGILVEGNRSDGIFRSLLHALDGAGLVYRVIDRNDQTLNLKIGRHT